MGEGKDDDCHSSFIVESGCKRRRDNNGDDDDDYEDQNENPIRRGGKPVFFSGSNIKSRDEEDSTNNNDDDGNSSRTTKGDNHRRDQINSDPSLCTFQAAIVQDDALLSFSNYPEERSKTIDYHDTMIEIRESKRKVLLFRFGHRFVFRVDDSAIVEIRYEPGSDLDDDTTIDNQNGDDKSPLSKRQKLDSSRPSSTAAENGSAKTTTRRQLPPSMLISFNTCSFRVFSLEKQNNFGSNKTTDVTMEDTNRPSSRIWSTLKPKVAETSVEDTLMKARSVLLQHFDIANNQRRGRLGCPKLWKMAPPGSGIAFHTWPEDTFDGSRFHHAPTQSASESAKFLSEGWSCCMYYEGNQEIRECPSSVTTSPRKSGSQSKSSGSSTHFEHGQKELVPTSSSSQSQSTKSAVENGGGAKHQHEERTGAPEQLSSELSHETKPCDDDGGGGDGKPNGIQPSTVHEEGNNLVASEKTNNDVCTKENDEEDNHGGTSQIDNGKVRRGDEGMDTDQKAANPQQLWKDEICKKYKSFDQSATHVDKAMEAKTFAVSSQHLTSCAESLSASYLSMNEFTMRTQECEDDINRITTELEAVLEMMFPARGGRKSNEALTLTCEKSGEFQRKIEELFTERKEAVAAKLALLLMPKR